MARKYKRKTGYRTEQERGLRVQTQRRDAPDLELLARVIVNMANDDPLHLGNDREAMEKLIADCAAAREQPRLPTSVPDPPPTPVPGRPEPLAESDSAEEQALASMGRMIRDIRRTAKLTQAQLAQRVGLTPVDISAMERGKVAPTPDTLARIATATGHRLRISPEQVTVPPPAGWAANWLPCPSSVPEPRGWQCRRW
ncbi:MAG: helix-turn-helix domain-containing protein [Propionibacteriaceae bacterium]|nr:helix-turn-helix domain-containing protein [Propionibacteriaceae bacterium]